MLYCLLFILLVKCAARNNGVHCIYFYPPEFLDEAQKRGIADKAAVMKKGKRFILLLCIIMLIALLAIIAVWNRVTDFKTAYLQAALFLIGMNWFDGIVVDKLWVGHSKLWVIRGMEGIPYTKPWKAVFIKRGIATAAYLVISLAVAGLAVLLAQLFV